LQIYKLNIKLIQNLKFKIKHNYRGFTLIELLIYLSIVSIFITGAIYFTIDLLHIQIKSEVEQNVSHNLNLVSKRISYEIQQAISINSASGSTLSLNLPDSNRSPTIIDFQSGRIRIGFGNSGSCSSSSPCNLTDNKINITNLNFTQLQSGTESASINFTITAQNNSLINELNYSQNYSGNVELRVKQ